MAERENRKDDDFRFEIVRHYGVISANAKGWSKELNSVSWNGRNAKYDIREWNPDHTKMGKGITFTEDEFTELASLISAQVLPEETQNANLYDEQIPA